MRIANTRIPLERVVQAFRAGMTPEQIVQDFDVLRVEDVYAVVGFYLNNRREVDDYMDAADSDAARLKHDLVSSFDPAGIRARLLARRDQDATK